MHKRVLNKSPEQRIVDAAEKVATSKDNLDALSWDRVSEIGQMLEGDTAELDLHQLGTELVNIAKANLSLAAHLGIDEESQTLGYFASAVDVSDDAENRPTGDEEGIRSLADGAPNVSSADGGATEPLGDVKAVGSTPVEPDVVASDATETSAGQSDEAATSVVASDAAVQDVAAPDATESDAVSVPATLSRRELRQLKRDQRHREKEAKKLGRSKSIEIPRGENKEEFPLPALSEVIDAKPLEVVSVGGGDAISSAADNTAELVGVKREDSGATAPSPVERGENVEPVELNDGADAASDKEEPVLAQQKEPMPATEQDSFLHGAHAAETVDEIEPNEVDDASSDSEPVGKHAAHSSSDNKSFATFKLVYSSSDGRMCIYEDADGHLVSVDSTKLV